MWLRLYTKRRSWLQLTGVLVGRDFRGEKLMTSRPLQALCCWTVLVLAALLYSTGSTRNAAAEDVIGYAFAKASPLTVYEAPDLTGAHSRNFDYGVAYDVTERASGYVKLRLPDGKSEYAKAAHLLVVPGPRWLASTSAFRHDDRSLISFWQSSAKLNDFLAGIDTANSDWDYREFIATAPTYDLKLPIFATDTLELLGGDREVNIAGVLVPVTREMNESFNRVVSNSDKKLDIHFALDVSGSTTTFLEDALWDISKALQRDETLRGRINTADVTTFRLGVTPPAVYRGPMPFEDIPRQTWHSKDHEAPTDGDIEPLSDGLKALADGLKGQAASDSSIPVTIVLSGADIVESSVSSIDLGAVGSGSMIFAQITPEPGESLRKAARSFRDASVQLVDFGPKLVGNQVGSQLRRALEAKTKGPVDPKAFGQVAESAARMKMLAFLPKRPSAERLLPQPQTYARQADWYTVPLWVTVDDLVLKESQ